MADATGDSPAPRPATRPPTGSATAPRPPVHRLTCDGRSGELFLIFLVNLALTVLTLGFYRFWGRTRIRRYVWSQTGLLGEPLEYTGRGIELFLGFLIAFALVYGPAIGLYFLLGGDLPDPDAQPSSEQLDAVLIFGIIILGATPLLMLFYYVALFAAWRYRIGRTSWLGIRGGMEGSAWRYGVVGLGLGFLNAMTAGWTKPWADSVVFRYRLDRTWFGNRRFRSLLDAKGLYGGYAIAWLGTALAVIVVIIVLFTLRDSLSAEAESGMATWELQGLVLAVELTPLLVYQLLICGYKAALVRRIAATLTYGPVRFRVDVGFWDVFRLRIPNLLLMLFTLGFAYPWVVMRTVRFIARHLEFHGDIRTAAIGQTTVASPVYGEGLMEVLGIGTI